MDPPPLPTGTRPSWATAPIFVPLGTAILGLIGGALVGTLKSRADLALEDKRLQSQLILQAIQTGEPNQAATNLRFLLQIGLLPDTASKLRAYLDSGGAVPFLPATTQPAEPRAEIARGDTILVRMTLPYAAEVSWYRDQWKDRPDLYQVLPGQLGPGDTTFAIVPGGTIHIRIRKGPNNPWSAPKRVDCTRQARCATTLP